MRPAPDCAFRAHPIRKITAFSRSHWHIVRAVCLVLVLASRVAARVFWDTPGGETSGVIAADSAWSRAYAAMLRINGGRAGLEVWSARLSLDETVGALRAKLRQNGGALWATGSGEMVWCIGCDGERVFRFLISAADGPRNCHIFQLSQSFDDFMASLRPPADHLLKSAPAFPGSEEKTFLASDLTRTEFATASASASAGEVKSFYAQQLTASGWSPAFQPGKGMDVYLRGDELMLVSTESAGESGGSLIILLHKPLSSAERN